MHLNSWDGQTRKRDTTPPPRRRRGTFVHEVTTSLFPETKEVAQFLCGRLREGGAPGKRREEGYGRGRTAKTRRDWKENDDAMGFSPTAKHPGSKIHQSFT